MPKTFETLAEALVSVSDKRQRFVQSRSNSKRATDGLSVFRIEWPSMVRQNFPKTPCQPVSQREAKNLKDKLIAPLLEAGHSVASFIEFVVVHWKSIKGSYSFSKFRHYPELPAIGWLIKFSDLYLREFYQFQENDLEPVEDSKVSARKNTASMLEAVHSARKVVVDQGAELARLRAENQQLRARLSSNTLRSAKKPASKPSMPSAWV
jgi:hypothetical protein